MRGCVYVFCMCEGETGIIGTAGKTTDCGTKCHTKSALWKLYKSEQTSKDELSLK